MRFSFCSYRFALRILILLVVGWMTALIFNSLMMAVPLLLGRTLLQAVSDHLASHGIKHDGNIVMLLYPSCMMYSVS